MAEWYTHTTQNRAEQSLRVRVSLPAQKKNGLGRFLFTQSYFCCIKNTDIASFKKMFHYFYRANNQTQLKDTLMNAHEKKSLIDQALRQTFLDVPMIDQGNPYFPADSIEPLERPSKKFSFYKLGTRADKLFVRALITDDPDDLAELLSAQANTNRHPKYASAIMGVYVSQGKRVSKLVMERAHLAVKKPRQRKLTAKLGDFVNTVETAHIPILDKRTVIFDVQRYYEEPTLWDRLSNLKKTCLDDEEKRIIGAFVDEVVAIHSLRPDTTDRAALNKLCNESLRKYSQRCVHYLPFGRPHPILNEESELIVFRLIRSFAKKWANRGDLICAGHRDLRLTNVGYDGTSIHLFDFSPRGGWILPGEDIGRLIVDPLELFLKTGEPIFNEWGNYFLTDYLRKTRRMFILEQAKLGTVAKVLIRSDPEQVENYCIEFGSKLFYAGINLSSKPEIIL
jgi:hypothetical protein